jgi:hypothetical protein
MDLWTDGSRIVRAGGVTHLEGVIGEVVTLRRDRRLSAVEDQTSPAVAEAIRDAVGGLQDRLKAFPLLSDLVGVDLEWRGLWRVLRSDEYVRIGGVVHRVEDLMPGSPEVIAVLVAGEWASP